MTEKLHIASLIVHLRPQNRAGFRRWADSREGLVIELDSPEGKLVLLAETASSAEINVLLEQLQARPGVLNAVLVYHEELDASTCGEAMPRTDGETDLIKIVGET